jgi:hypothetical protein
MNSNLYMLYVYVLKRHFPVIRTQKNKGYYVVFTEANVLDEVGFVLREVIK